MLPISGVCSLVIGGCDPVRSNKFRGIYGLIYPKSLRGLFFLRWILPHSGVCSLYAGGCGPVRYCSCIRWLKHLLVLSRKGLLTSAVVFLYNFIWLKSVFLNKKATFVVSLMYHVFYFLFLAWSGSILSNVFDENYLSSYFLLKFVKMVCNGMVLGLISL